MKVLIVIVLLAIIGISFFVFNSYFREKTVGGQVIDCQTENVISNAEVIISQRGWGLDNGLIWDKAYVSETQTNENGQFSANFRVGTKANILISKNGYVTAQQFEDPEQRIVVRMLQGDNPTEVTYNCTLSSECLQTVVEDNVQVTKNICL